MEPRVRGAPADGSSPGERHAPGWLRGHGGCLPVLAVAAVLGGCRVVLGPLEQRPPHWKWRGVQVRVHLGQIGMTSFTAEPQSSSLRDGVEHCFFGGCGTFNEPTFETCLGDELEVLSITISCGSLKITSPERSDK